MLRRLVFAVPLLVCVMITPALADDDKPKADKSGYTLFNPVPDDLMRDFSPDRPSRMTGPYTVDAGHFQIETDFLDFAYADHGGQTTHSYETADPLLRLGLTSNVDVEIKLDGLIDTRTRGNATGATLSSGRGFGDITLLSKINLIGNGGGKIAFALEPTLRLATGAHAVSDGGIEGGLLAPLTVSLPSFSLGVQAEADVLKNEDAPGRHLTSTEIVSLSHSIPGIDKLTGTVELYGSQVFQAHQPDEYTFDTALAYQIGKNTQIDGGVNVGLSAGAPNCEAYAGFARRF